MVNKIAFVGFRGEIAANAPLELHLLHDHHAIHTIHEYLLATHRYETI